MQPVRLFIAALTLMAVVPSQAQQDLSGVWEGLLVVAPGSEIEVQFSFESDGSGGYSGLLNAPDQPSLTDVALDSVSLDGSALEVQVSAVNGSYSGDVSGDAITGTWQQQGQEFELNLTPYEEPVLTAETFALVEGSWVGSIRPVPNAEMELTLVLEFEEPAAGEYAAFLSVPDQGAQDIPADAFFIDGDELTVQIGQMRLEINGTLAGDTFSGNFTQAGRELPLNMSKGEYEQEGLSLAPLAFARLQGPWHGEVGGLTVVIRVEQDGDNYFAWLDSPDQGAADIPLTSLSLEQDSVSFTVNAAGVEFSGELEDGRIVGNWNQAGASQPLTLEQGAYDVAAGLDSSTREALNGTWRGEVNGTELVFTFAGSNGASSATLAIPAMGAQGLGLAELEMTGQQLSFAVRGIQATYSGTLGDGELRGQWTRAGNTSELVLVRQ